MDLKVCTKCGKEKPFTDFSKDKFSNIGIKPSCKECNCKARAEKVANIAHIIVTEKTCKKCNITFPISNFLRVAHNFDGLSGSCRQCDKERDSVKMPEKLKRANARRAQIKIENPELLKKKGKESYLRHKDYRKIKDKEYRERPEIKEKMKLRGKLYRENNKDKILAKTRSYYQRVKNTEAFKTWKAEYHKKKKKTSAKYVLVHKLATSARRSLTKKRINSSWNKVLLYKTVDLIEHLKEKHGDVFEKNVLVDGYALDHIVPIAYFDFNSINSLDFHLCWRLENLQLMDKIENIKKSDRIDLDYQQPLLQEINFFRSYPEMYRVR